MSEIEAAEICEEIAERLNAESRHYNSVAMLELLANAAGAAMCARKFRLLAQREEADA
jgi:hypothetical protein